MESHCPECGRELHGVTHKEALRIADAKKKYLNNLKNVQNKEIPKIDNGHKALALCCFGVFLIMVVGGLLSWG
ncbi:MAG: hypothetical protein K8E24_015795 [Methanobacterium paludis]|nr:hypothetical protein [Methanobacterium paludis]